MGIQPLAVVGHVGPDLDGRAMDEPHALAALAALGQPTRLAIFRLLVRTDLTACQPARSPKKSAVRTIRFRHTSRSLHAPVWSWHARGPNDYLPGECGGNASVDRLSRHTTVAMDARSCAALGRAEPCCDQARNQKRRPKKSRDDLDAHQSSHSR